MAFTDVVKIATDANYDAGAETWSATPTKTSLNASVLAKGLIPKQGLYAQYFNYMLNNAQSTIEVVQSMLKFLSTDLSISLDDADDDFLSNAIQSIVDTGDDATLASANAYTDAEVADAINYTDTEVASALSASESYTDTEVGKALTRAQIYSAIKNGLISAKRDDTSTTLEELYSISLAPYKAGGAFPNEKTIVAVGANGGIYTCIPSEGLFEANIHKRFPGSAYAGTFNSIDYNGSMFVAVGTSGGIQTSTNLSLWIAETPPSSYTGTYYQVIWNSVNSIWVAIGSGGAIHTSPDGTTWTARTYPAGTTGDPVSIATSGSDYCIRTTSTDAITSGNGTTWTRVATVAGADPTHGNQLAYGGGYYVCVSGTGAVSRSVTGASWSSTASPTIYDFSSDSNVTADIESICSDEQYENLYACCDAGRSILLSEDGGATWTQIPTDFFNPRKMIYASGMLMGVSEDNRFWYSGRFGETFRWP